MRYLAQIRTRMSIALRCVMVLVALGSCLEERASGLQQQNIKGISVVSIPVQKARKKHLLKHRQKRKEVDSLLKVQDSMDVYRSRMVFTFVSYGG